MKTLLRFSIAFVILMMVIAGKHLTSVDAQAYYYCGNPQDTCKANASSQKSSCNNACASQNPVGSAPYNQCAQGCSDTYNTSVNQCSATYSSCITSQTNGCKYSYCPSINACPSPNSVKNATYDDPSGSCGCACQCSGTPPGCSGVTCSGNGSWACDSPIIIDTKGEGFHLTDVQHGVWFDFQGDGTSEHIAWTDPAYSNGWLALDRNGNGKIDNASELFGNVTNQPPSPNANGYLALAVFDEIINGGNADGFITEEDSVFAKLRVWIDSDHDGISQPFELHSLKELGVSRIDLNYTEVQKTDEYGNLFRYRARVWDHRGQHGNRFTYDVFLQ